MALLSGARQSTHRRCREQDGYVLLTLLLVVSLMVIAAAAVLPLISFELRRDREQEMIHRGVQYSRAIRAYYKKFGRYPTRLEDLESTNNLRFLRKRYKDPLNKNQDFKLLHFGDPGLKLTGTIGGGTIPGANPVGSPGGFNSPGGFSQPSSAFGGNPNTGFGASSNSATGLNAPGANPAADPSQASSSSSSNSQDSSSTSSSTKISSAGAGDLSSSGQIVGGGPIVGVISASKKDTIREFNHKKKYNEWQFIYDPATDRGGLITTPNQPPLQGFGTQPGQNAQTGGATGNSFTPLSGLGNNPNPGGQSPPPQPPANPPQPQ